MPVKHLIVCGIEKKLEEVVPVCHSWPGLRNWVLCITSCSLRMIGDIEESNKDSLYPFKSKDGLVVCKKSPYGLLQRLGAHMGALVLLTAPPGASQTWDWDLP